MIDMTPFNQALGPSSQGYDMGWVDNLMNFGTSPNMAGAGNQQTDWLKTIFGSSGNPNDNGIFGDTLGGIGGLFQIGQLITGLNAYNKQMDFAKKQYRDYLNQQRKDYSNSVASANDQSQRRYDMARMAADPRDPNVQAFYANNKPTQLKA